MRFNNFNYNAQFSTGSEPWRENKSYEARMQKVKRLLTVEEYELLTEFNVNYTEEEFIKYTDILSKLAEAGVFRLTGDPVADEALGIVAASANIRTVDPFFIDPMGENGNFKPCAFNNIWNDESKPDLDDGSIFDELDPADEDSILENTETIDSMGDPDNE